MSNKTGCAYNFMIHEYVCVYACMYAHIYTYTYICIDI